MIKTAVIGFGLSAQTFHLPFLKVSDQYQIVAISTRQEAQAQAAYPGVAVFASATELLSAQIDLDLVVITAPNAVHFELAQAALSRNLHVVLEKPFVNTVAEGEALMALAAEKQKLLSVYHNRRWDGDFLTLQALIKRGDLGEIHSLESHFDRFRPVVQKRWREAPGPGAGVWYDLGAHLLDQALVLFGLPQALTARCLALRPGAQVTDYFHVQLHYPKTEVVLHACPFVAGQKMRFLLAGSQGSYLKYGLDPQEERLKQGVLPLDADWGREEPAAFGMLSTDQNTVYPTVAGTYQSYYAQLASALLEGGANPVPAVDALQVIRLIALAEQSSLRGETLRLEF